MTTATRRSTVTRNGTWIALWFAAVVLALFFALMGIPKVLGLGGWSARFAGWGYPPWFGVVVGVAEVGGAVLLLVPRLAMMGAVVLAILMLGAAATHILHGEYARVGLPVALFAVLTLIAWKRRPS